VNSNRILTVQPFTDPYDVPLPGLDLPGPVKRPGQGSGAPRPYSSTLDPTPQAVRRFWSRVVKAPGEGCWLLVSAVSGVDGYTRISWRRNGVSRTESGHRFALLLAGQLADGVVAEHRCNEPLCVRVDPGHVIASTQTANLRYAVACGRAGDNRRPATSHDRRARSVAVREALRHGWDPDAYAAASGITPPPQYPTLF